MHDRQILTKKLDGTQRWVPFEGSDDEWEHLTATAPEIVRTKPEEAPCQTNTCAA
jgi:hypothetical protein